MEPPVRWCSRHNPTPWVRLSRHSSKLWYDQASLSAPEYNFYIQVHHKYFFKLQLGQRHGSLINIQYQYQCQYQYWSQYPCKYLVFASDNYKSPRFIAFPVQRDVDHFLRHLQSKQASPLKIFDWQYIWQYFWQYLDNISQIISKGNVGPPMFTVCKYSHFPIPVMKYKCLSLCTYFAFSSRQTLSPVPVFFAEIKFSLSKATIVNFLISNFQMLSISQNNETCLKLYSRCFQLSAAQAVEMFLMRARHV